MVSLHASTLASVALITACLAGLIRLFVLRLAPAHPSLVFFFACESAIVATSETVGVHTYLYAYSFILFVLLEWFAFGFVLRALYGAIFVRYKGIEILGRWSIYAALTVSCMLGLVGAASTGHWMREKGTLIIGVEFASGCIIVGSVFLVGSILFAISHYPIALPRNVLMNCRFFALFMTVEAVALLLNSVTQGRQTGNLNVVEILMSAVILFIWPLLLSQKGELTILKVRHGIDPGEEARLLSQLNAFNSLLLRVARK